MKYYVISDTHGFYDETTDALTKAGWYSDSTPHKLVICGDLMDRGGQALEMQNFVCDLLERDEVVLVKGNHEDLFEDLLDRFDYYMQYVGIANTVHYPNGTFDTALQLAHCDFDFAYNFTSQTVRRLEKSAYVRKILPQMRDYFETEHYVFVHGWFPCTTRAEDYVCALNKYKYYDDWRQASAEEWKAARWLHGMDCAVKYGATVPGKTTVCGHWHCSYGHAKLEGDRNGVEYGPTADYTPFYADGVIAIDACTAVSRVVNCVVIED